MKSPKATLLTLFVFCLINISCTEKAQNPVVQKDPLPSWNSSKTKTAILDFVSEVVDPASQNFVPVAERIAVFDNDGNLWAEQPAYFQLFFAMDRIAEMADEHPEWKEKQPFKAVLEKDIESLKAQGVHGLLELVLQSHAGMTTEAFEAQVSDWLSSAKHPSLNRPYTDLVYQPMLELIDHLKNNEFKVFIVSGGGIEFMRPWVEEVYGIPRDQVVGSSIKTRFDFEGDKPVIRRLPEIDFIDDKEGKPIGIHKHIGRKPIFSSGNSDGDLAMMQWTASGSGQRFMLYLHHTDSIREWAYDRHSAVGKLDKGLDEALAKGWTITDMEKDWKLIYPHQLKD